MARQKPTMTTADVIAAGLTRSPTGAASPLVHARSADVHRRRILAGETERQARERWDRERALEIDRDADPRLDGTGRIRAVRYDD